MDALRCECADAGLSVIDAQMPYGMCRMSTVFPLYAYANAFVGRIGARMPSRTDRRHAVCAVLRIDLRTLGVLERRLFRRGR